MEDSLLNFRFFLYSNLLRSFLKNISIPRLAQSQFVSDDSFFTAHLSANKLAKCSLKPSSISISFIFPIWNPLTSSKNPNNSRAHLWAHFSSWLLGNWLFCTIQVSGKVNMFLKVRISNDGAGLPFKKRQTIFWIIV